MTQTNTGLHGPVILAPKKNIVLDATMLSSLMSCARMVDMRFNHNLMPINGKSNSLEVGSIVHKGLEVSLKMQMNGFSRSQSNATGLVAARLYADGCAHCAGFVASPDTPRPTCGHAPDEYPGVQNTPETADNAYVVTASHAINTLEEYFDHYKNDYWVTLGVEFVEGKVLYEDDEIRILWKAKLDWKIDNNQGIYPVDHKTSKQRRLKNRLNNQFIGQCLVVGSRAMIVNNIGFQKTLKPHEKFTREMMSYSSDLLHEWQSEILPYWGYKLLEYQESGFWAPNFTHCENKYGNCPFLDVCSSDRNMREQEVRVKFMVGPPWDPTNSGTDNGGD